LYTAIVLIVVFDLRRPMMELWLHHRT